jgi:hypothetical protein
VQFHDREKRTGSHQTPIWFCFVFLLFLYMGGVKSYSGTNKKKQAVDQAKLNALNSLQQERTSS